MGEWVGVGCCSYFKVLSQLLLEKEAPSGFLPQESTYELAISGLTFFIFLKLEETTALLCVFC